MTHEHTLPRFRRTGWLVGAAFLALAPAAPGRADEDRKKPRYPKPPSATNVQLVPDAWKTVQVRKLSPSELDRLLSARQKADNVGCAGSHSTTKLRFIRRVYLDLTGKLPPPRAVRAFITDEASGQAREAD